MEHIDEFDPLEVYGRIHPKAIPQNEAFRCTSSRYYPSLATGWIGGSRMVDFHLDLTVSVFGIYNRPRARRRRKRAAKTAVFSPAVPWKQWEQKCFLGKKHLSEGSE
jgi:hypothetical protein